MPEVALPWGQSGHTSAAAGRRWPKSVWGSRASRASGVQGRKASMASRVTGQCSTGRRVSKAYAAG